MPKSRNDKKSICQNSNAKYKIAFKSKTQKVRGKKSHHQSVKRTKSEMEKSQPVLESNVKSQNGFGSK